MNGERLGHYPPDAVTGAGTMSVVYRAFDTVEQRTVALERLRPELATDADFRVRFRRESAPAARINAPHVIPIHDYGEIDGRSLHRDAARQWTTISRRCSPRAPAL